VAAAVHRLTAEQHQPGGGRPECFERHLRAGLEDKELARLEDPLVARKRDRPFDDVSNVSST
jgi:hypothetical protein